MRPPKMLRYRGHVIEHCPRNPRQWRWSVAPDCGAGRMPDHERGWSEATIWKALQTVDWKLEDEIAEDLLRQTAAICTRCGQRLHKVCPEAFGVPCSPPEVTQ